ncbi:MAG TPA: DUF2917 domain-containing protein [Noviherbaspirillum sp.]|nr:DUF2917 domain-containing protein [Noviherbaspirillum sp.]
MHTSFVKNIAHIAHHHPDGTSSRAAMELKPKGEALLLRHNDYLHIHRAQGWTVTPLSGAVWVTQDGDVRDIVLVAGESFTLDGKGLAMLSAFGEARICITRDVGRCTEASAVDASSDTVPAARPAFA